MTKITVDTQLLKDAMHAIARLHGFLGIDLDDHDEGYGETYDALESALKSVPK